MAAALWLYSFCSFFLTLKSKRTWLLLVFLELQPFSSYSQNTHTHIHTHTYTHSQFTLSLVRLYALRHNNESGDFLKDGQPLMLDTCKIMSQHRGRAFVLRSVQTSVAEYYVKTCCTKHFQYIDNCTLSVHSIQAVICGTVKM